MDGDEARWVGVRYVARGACGYDDGTTYYLVSEVERLVEREKNEVPEEGVDEYGGWDAPDDYYGVADFCTQQESWKERQRNSTQEDLEYELYQDQLYDYS